MFWGKSKDGQTLRGYVLGVDIQHSAGSTKACVGAAEIDVPDTVLT